MPDWITVDEAIKLSDYTSNHLSELLERGRIKARKFGHAWQVSRASLLAYTRKARQRGNKPGPKPKGHKV